ncbi:uncharacterized protein TNCV_1249661 [Trichonephila clavipes]|nr:uncharacterized protein TNCV_1249661 [Trichonephila clavipes]
MLVEINFYGRNAGFLRGRNINECIPKVEMTGRCIWLTRCVDIDKLSQTYFCVSGTNGGWDHDRECRMLTLQPHRSDFIGSGSVMFSSFWSVPFSSGLWTFLTFISDGTSVLWKTLVSETCQVNVLEDISHSQASLREADHRDENCRLVDAPFCWPGGSFGVCRYKFLGAVDTRRYPSAENRVWSDQEDHEEGGSKDRAASPCGPHSDSLNDTSRRRRSNFSTNNFQTPCRSKS